MNKQIAIAVALMTSGGALHAAKLPPIEPAMVAIKGGEFMMGSARDAMSQPVRKVVIKPFRMGKYEVTAEEYRRFVEATSYRAPRMCMQMAYKNGFVNVPNEYRAAATLQAMSKFEPATCIGWNGASAYVKWLAKETGRKYRLPTEAEWEYAHRAGSEHRYFYGNDETQACRYGNLADRSAEAALRRDFGTESKEYVGVMPCDDKAEYASIVGMYEPNAFGLHDTLGNVTEALEDCFQEDYRGAPNDGSARVAADCSKRSVRGGSWHWRGYHATRRGVTDPAMIGSVEGFRVAEDIVGDVPAAARPGTFDIELAAAQTAERARRALLAELK